MGIGKVKFLSISASMRCFGGIRRDVEVVRTSIRDKTYPERRSR